MDILGAMILGAILSIAVETPTVDSAVSRYGEDAAACAAMSDMDGQQCLARLLEPSDAELTAAYAAAHDLAKQQGRAAELSRAQAAWSEFANAQCAFERAQFEGGTGYWSTSYICHLQRNAARTDELRRGANR